MWNRLKENYEHTFFEFSSPYEMQAAIKHTFLKFWTVSMNKIELGRSPESQVIRQQLIYMQMHLFLLDLLFVFCRILQ
jgi:hypothetical protein